MGLLRRAANETVRELGLNVATIVKAILVLGFSILILSTFATPSAPETGSLTGFALWLAKSLAWLLAVVVVFVLLLAWNTLKVAQRDRSVYAHQRMAAESAASVDNQMKSLLRNTLINPWYGVAKCYAFGSVVGQYPTRDVDIAIQFDSSRPGQIQIYRDRLRSVEGMFQEFYSLKLHVQTFLSNEDEALHTFLNDAGMHERIMWR